MTSNTTSETCATIILSRASIKSIMNFSSNIDSTYILILNIGLGDSVLIHSKPRWKKLQYYLSLKVLSSSCTVSLLKCLSIHLSVLSVCFICLSVFLSASLLAYLHDCLSAICLSVCLYSMSV